MGPHRPQRRTGGRAPELDGLDGVGASQTELDRVRISSNRPVGRSVGLIGLLGVIRKFVLKIKKNQGFIGVYIYIYISIYL